MATPTRTPTETMALDRDEDEEKLVAVALVLHHRITFMPAMCVMEVHEEYCHEGVEGLDEVEQLHKNVPPRSYLMLFLALSGLFAALTVLPFVYSNYLMQHPCEQKNFDIKGIEASGINLKPQASEIHLKEDDPFECDIIDMMRSTVSLLWFPSILVVLVLSAVVKWIIVKATGSFDLFFWRCGPRRIVQLLWYSFGIRTKLHRVSFSQTIPTWIFVVGYQLYLLEFGVVSLRTASPFTHFLLAYIMGEIFLKAVNYLLGLSDHAISIVEAEIKSLGLRWVYKQNTRTLTITDEELESLRPLVRYPLEKLSDTEFLNPQNAWPTEVYLSGRKRLIEVRDIPRDILSEDAGTSDYASLRLE
jgi:hypothetical protein